MALKRPFGKPRLVLYALRALLLLTLLSPQVLLAQQAVVRDQGKPPARDETKQVLRHAREQLTDYYSKIESIRLAYTREWTPSPAFAERAQARRQEIDRESDVKERASSYDLLFTPVGQRFITRTVTTLIDDSLQEKTYFRYLQNGRRTDIVTDVKQAFITSDARDGLIDRHPLHCLGLAIPGSETLRLTDLLSLADVARLEEREQIEGQTTLVLTIGPGIPDAQRAHGWNEETWIKVWLASELHYIPLKMEIHYRNARPPYSTACRKFAPAANSSGEPAAIFPRETDFADAGGMTRFTVEEVTLRPVVQEADLTPQIPADFLVYKDGVRQERVIPEPNPPRDLEVQVLDIHGEPVKGASVTVWARGSSINAIRAAKEGRTSNPQPLGAAVTDDEGKLVLELVPGEDVTLWADHPDLRDSRWIIGPTLKQHRMYLLPRTPVTVLDEKGKPVEGVELSSKVFPSPTGRELRAFPPGPEDVTDASGTVLLESEHTVRRPDEPVRFFALADDGRAAIAARPANGLEAPLELTLRPVRVVRATIELDFDGPDSLPIIWADELGNTLVGDVAKRSEDEQQSRRYVVKFPLPPGTYLMTVRKTDTTDELVVPVEVPRGTGEVELGTFSPGMSSLKQLEGQPAPELAVRWRPGAETTPADLKGNVVVLDFWGFWCGPCLEAMPTLISLADEFKDEPVVWLAIHDASLADMDELQEHLARLEKAWTLKFNLTPVLDQPEVDQDGHGGITCSRYGVHSWPMIVIVDQAGKVVGSVKKDEIEPTVRRLLGE